MKSWGNRTDFHRQVSAGLTARAADGPEAVAPVLTDELARWLSQLTLLYGMPVEYLIPDARLLPTESMRFFYLDRNWLDRLVDGAMSVGVLSSKENVFNQAFFAEIYRQVDAAQLQVRNAIRSAPPAEVTGISGTMTGLLFRSQVVSAFPGVEIKAYDDQNNLLRILRMDRLSNAVILCIFEGIPTRVDFIQPGEGLHFGVPGGDGVVTTFDLPLRGLGFPNGDPQPSGYPAGAQIETSPGSEVYVKAKGSALSGASEGVIDIAGLVKNVETTMNALKPAALKDGKLTPGGLAIQLTVGAGIQSYAIKTKKGDAPPACEVND